MSKQFKKQKPVVLDDFDDEFENDYDGYWFVEPKGRKRRKTAQGQSEKYKSAYHS